MNKKATRLTLLLFLLLAPFTAWGQATTDGLKQYRIDSANSILRIYAGRAGLLARMGHNHVVHSRQISGEVKLADELLDSSASFYIPVSSLIVDAPEERARAGAGFESQPGESAIAGTRENMLGSEVLNAGEFPQIEITVTPISMTSDAWLCRVELLFQGRSYRQEIPVQLAYDASKLSAEASFSLAHESIGLSPFTALGGTLRVAETLDFELQIQAVAH